MSDYKKINDDVIQALKPPGWSYRIVMVIFAAGVMALLVAWIYQIRMGMGVAGISFPTGWAIYIGSFVFWIGIAHSGTLISAILYLVRSKWRTAVSRSAEAMTIIAILTAGMFPLIHLGRFWVFYYIIPYPSQRQIWPNFQSPLVFDLVAIFTYFTVSVIFFYVGLVPDIAAARDHYDQQGRHGFRWKLYRALALGWHGRSGNWHHHGRSYLYFAALATPLVISVHSVVSWDFATGILPGWHSTIFPPYFVAGAIHSGLAMVLTLLIPMRKFLHLENLIRPKHFEDVALTMIVTMLIIAYSYVIELFMAWYSGDIFEEQFTYWRLTGSWRWFYPIIVTGNVLLPSLFIFRWVRTKLSLLFLISIFVNVGMWSERLWLVAGSPMHDFLPHNWGSYLPTWVELTILSGSIAFFLFGFFVMAKYFPAAPMSDIKTDAEQEQPKKEYRSRAYIKLAELPTGVVGVFGKASDLLEAVDHIREHATHGLEVYAPCHVKELPTVMGRRPDSPVRWWTLVGGLLGCAGGFALAGGSALVQSLVVGGKHPISIIPYCIPGFEGTILMGSLANFAGMLIYARLPWWKTPPGYDWRFSRDKFGLFVAGPAGRLEGLREVMKSTHPEEIVDVRS
jgi:Ni/Fe-hydrogenase subunit HybB-like protein